MGVSSGKSRGLVFAGLGMEVIGLMVGSVIVGTEIDKYFDLPGYSVFVLLLSSFGAWVWRIIHMAQRFMNEDNDEQ